MSLVHVCFIPLHLSCLVSAALAVILPGTEQVEEGKKRSSADGQITAQTQRAIFCHCASILLSVKIKASGWRDTDWCSHELLLLLVVHM